MSHVKGVTARIAHACENCHWVPSLRGTKSILPGHRYLLWTAFPRDDGFDALERPFSIRECATCAIERDDFTATSFGICGSFCHGVNPCVLPFERGAPGHECVCRECAKTPGGAS